LQAVLGEEYPELIHRKNLRIKISGCMNSCGQHAIADIGFQGMTMRSGPHIAPALQVLLGGGVAGDGAGRMADKLIKVPAKRGPQALRTLLDDFAADAIPDEAFQAYYLRKGKDHFYRLLKPLSDSGDLQPDDFIDWGRSASYRPAIGVGECAGVTIDLVATLLLEAEEKLEQAEAAFGRQAWADSLYHSQSALINGAKALLVGEQHKTNTQAGIVREFDQHFIDSGAVPLDTSFTALVDRVRQEPPTGPFAQDYLATAKSVHQTLLTHRQKTIDHAQR
ncbi:MAG: nitrite reductase, partial [Bacteroidota bacterium]